MTRAQHARTGAHRLTRVDALAPPEDPASALAAFLQRVDERLQQRALVLGHVQHVDAQELFGFTRAELRRRAEEFAASDEDERLTVTWLVLARHARVMARRNEGRSAPPPDYALLDAARDLRPDWALPRDVLLSEHETAVFRAMAHVGEPARSVLVLHWLGVEADDVADELQLGADAVARLRGEARAQLRHLLAAAGRR